MVSKMLLQQKSTQTHTKLNVQLETISIINLLQPGQTPKIHIIYTAIYSIYTKSHADARCTTCVILCISAVNKLMESIIQTAKNTDSYTFWEQVCAKFHLISVHCCHVG